MPTTVPTVHHPLLVITTNASPTHQIGLDVNLFLSTLVMTATVVPMTSVKMSTDHLSVTTLLSLAEMHAILDIVNLPTVVSPKIQSTVKTAIPAHPTDVMKSVAKPSVLAFHSLGACLPPPLVLRLVLPLVLPQLALLEPTPLSRAIVLPFLHVNNSSAIRSLETVILSIHALTTTHVLSISALHLVDLQSVPTCPSVKEVLASLSHVT